MPPETAFTARRSLVYSLALLLIVLFWALQQSPALVDQGRDSGIFAYTGWVVAEGGMPYRDAWDNKAPGVYLVNAAAIRLLGVNRWALWAGEALFTLAAAALLFALLDGLFKRAWLALFGVLLYVALTRHYGLLASGNFTESYALLPQMACYVLVYRLMLRPRAKMPLMALLLGLSAAAAFSFKQSSIGMALALVPALLIARHPLTPFGLKQPFLGVQGNDSPAGGAGAQPSQKTLRVWAWLAYVILGGLIGLALLSAYLLIGGAGSEGWDAIMIAPAAFHNWVEAAPIPVWESLRDSLRSETMRYQFLPLAPFILLAFFALPRLNLERRALLIWFLLAFFAELILCNLTGRAYFHYYLAPALPLVLIVVFMLGWILEWGRGVWRILPFAYVAFILLTFLVDYADTYNKRLGDPFSAPYHEPLADYIAANTRPDERVLVWGASSELNFQSRRHSPTRFHYAYPLIVPNYTRAEQIETLLADLTQNQPVMIVDRAIIDGNRVPPLSETDRAAWLASGGRRDITDLSAVFNFVATHCTETDRFEGVAIYRCVYANALAPKASLNH